MSNDRVVLTKTGYERLTQELKQLKSVERPRIIAAISEARAHGDLSENAEYHSAREQQSFMEGRISELEAVLSVAEVIDPTTLDVGDRVAFGATVTVHDEEHDAEVTYQIVGDQESNIDEGLISIASPIARALIGKEEGDDVEVQAPGGIKRYEIIEVQYV